MDLEMIILSEVSQKEEDKHQIISFRCYMHLNYDANYLTYEAETDLQT